MLHIFWNICAFTITVGILVTIHELGHFSAARLCGVTIQRFSIGFGYILWKFRDKKNTEYVISAIPLGGYVKMLNKNDISITKQYEKQNQTFENKNIWQRILIIISGPMFNIIFAFLIYIFIFMIGISTYRPIITDIIPNSIFDKYHIPSHVEINDINNITTPDWESVRLQLVKALLTNKEKNIIINTTHFHSSQKTKYCINLSNWKFDINTQDIITSLGIIPLPTYIIKPTISKIQQNSSGMKAGLKIGDEIIAVNNQLIFTWEKFIKEIKHNPNIVLQLSIKRHNQILTIPIKPSQKIKNNKIEGFIGISPTYLPVSKKYTVTQQLGLIAATQKSKEKILNIIHITSSMLYKLIIGEIKLNNLGGPISIAQNAKIAATYGFISYLMFLSLLSIHLGIINLLPLPILDGGYLLFLIIEIFCGKKISEQIEKYTYHIGIILLILLMCLSILNDLSRLK